MVRSGALEKVLALTAIVAVSINLRIGVTEVGPLLDRIRPEVGMSAPLAGLLGTIPFACMGLFAPLGLRMVRRVSARRLTVACMLLIIVGTVARAVVPSAWLVVAATLPLGAGLAVAGVVLPGVIKTHFAQRTGAAMGAYVAALSFGGAVAALVIVPLADAVGSWRGAFALSAIPTLVCVPLWLLLPRPQADDTPDSERPPQTALAVATSPNPPRLIALLGAVFGFQSICFAAVINWISPLYHHYGWSLSKASFVTALVSILVVPGALVIPALSDRGDRHGWLLGSALLMAVGIFGFAFAPTTAAWLWIVAFGIGNGALFPLCLTLPQDLARDEHSRTLLTTWTLGLGYTVSATGPVLVGGLLDLTGGFRVPMAVIGSMAVLSGLVGLSPSLRRTAVRNAALRTADEALETAAE